jgi:hypothetical protein
MKTKYSVALILLCLLLLISPCFADWQQLSQTGSWTACDRTSWQGVPGQEGGSAIWQYLNVTDFAGYHAIINFSWLVNTRDWYDIQTLKKVQMVWNISNIYVSISCEDVKNWGGLFDNMWFYAGSNVNSSAFTANWWEFWVAKYVRDPTDFNVNWRDTYDIYVSKVNSTAVLVEIYKNGMDGATRMISNNYAVNSNFWSSVDITFKIWHEGKGYFKGGMTDEIYTGTYTPGVPGSFLSPENNLVYNFIKNLLNSVSKVLPSWLQDWITTFEAWWGFLFGLLTGIVMGIVKTAAPFLPFILIAWLLDATYASVQQGSIQPLGVFFMTMFNFVTAIIHTVVTIAAAIWSFIKFW